MRLNTMAVAVIATMLAVACGAAELDPKVQARIDAAVSNLQAWAAEPALVAAVRQANASPSEAAKAMTDKAWGDLALTDPFVRNLATNEASRVLLSRRDAVVVDLFLSAADGTKVAFSSKPEAWSHRAKSKHKLPMTGRNWQGALTITEPTLVQASVALVQVSVPVREGGLLIGSLAADLDLSLFVRVPQTKPVVMAADVRIAEEIVANLVQRIDALAADAQHPLFLRHLRSVKAMVQAEWARASIYEKSRTTETIRYVEAMLRGFNGRSADWDAYVQDGRSLFMAYVSPRDGTLQWYALTLPKGWDPKKTRDEQPACAMFFELHGRANPHSLHYPATQLDAGEGTAPVPDEERPASFAMIQRHGYHVYPFGRGNTGYRDIGETDLWEAYDDVHKTVNIDPDRRYLYGFSMGGGGTWQIASRTPDRWAAVAIMGAGVRAGEWGQAGNVSALPVYLWGGEDDTLGYRGDTSGRVRSPREQMTQFARAIEQAGGHAVVRSTPGIGHNYRLKEQEEAVNWLQQFARKRPDRFRFVADTDEHRGIWGIRMTRDLAASALPRFTCAIEGRVVRIETEGTPHIDVFPGTNGLNLTGEINVLVNGEERFAGPVTSAVLRLDIPAK